MSDTIYGIDLGTSTSAVACVERGRPRVIPAQGPDGSRFFTPSQVFLGLSSHALVGEAAGLARLEHADRTDCTLFEFFKRDLANDDPPAHYLEPVAGALWDPVALSTLVLRKLRLDVEAEGQKLVRAVVTHPQCFYVKQKVATEEAARNAGIEAVLTISEPQAAAFLHGFGENATEGRILLFDLGGGTLDVNVLEVGKGRLAVVGTDGHARLGGRDFDAVVEGMFNTLLQQEHGIEIWDGTPAEQEQCRVQAREVKETLSRRPTAKVNVTVRDRDVFATITRERFAEKCAPLLAQIAETTDRALASAGVTWNDLQAVIPIGGSTHMPVIKQWLKFRAEQRLVQVDEPELAVTRGAAVLGEILRQRGSPDIDFGRQPTAPPPQKITGLAERNFGVLVDEGTPRERVSPLVARGEQTPLSRGRDFATTDEGSWLSIPVVEYEDPRDWEMMGRCEISDLPRLPRGSRVRVTFDVKEGGSVAVTAEAGGRKATVALTLGARSAPRDLPPGIRDGRDLAKTLSIRVK